MAYKYKKTQLFAKKLDIPKSIRENVYNNRLSLEDYVIYELNGKIPTSCIIENERRVLEKFGFEAIRYLDFELIGKSFMYNNMNLYDKLLELDYIPNNLNHYLYELVDEHVYISSYTPGMTSYFHTRFLNAKELNEDDKLVASGFMSGSTDLTSILKRWYLFKDRDLDYFLRNDYNNRRTKLKTHNIHKFMEQYGSLFMLVSEFTNIYTFIDYVTDVTKTKEEISNYVKEFLENIITFSKSYQTELTNEEYREIFKYISLQELIEKRAPYSAKKILAELATLNKDYLFIQHIPTHVLLREDVLRLIEYYGLKVIVDFDKECGNLFSKNGYSLLREWWAMYLHYAGNNHDPNTRIHTKEYDPDDPNYYTRPYTKYEFYESIKRCLMYGPTDYKFAEYSPNFSAITGDFRDIYSNLFIDESVVKDPVFLELFYTHQLTSHHLRSHPEYIEYLRGKDLTVAFKRREIRVDITDYQNLYQYLVDRFGYDDAIVFIKDYHDVIEFVYDNRVLMDAYRWNVDVCVSTFDTLDEFGKYFNKCFIIPIENMYAKIPSDVPTSTKIMYPNLFLDDLVPDDIKESYYNREFNGELLVKYPDIIKYFNNVDISYGFSKEYEWLFGVIGVGVKQSNLNKLKYLECYNKISDVSLQNEFVEFITKQPDFGVEKLDLVTELLSKLSFSNSQEVYQFRGELAKQLLGVDDPIAGFNRIETMFTKNDLPTFVKLYKVFEILHPGAYGFNYTNDSMISPVLVNSTVRNRETIIQKDLFKASLLSNNRSLNNFFDVIKMSYEIYESGSFLNESEEKLLVKFRDILMSLLNKNYSVSDDIFKDISDLKDELIGDANLNLLDKIVKIISIGLFNNLDELYEYQTKALEEVDVRNRNRIREYGFGRLEVGDLIKGIGDIKFLNNILQNGSVSKEYLGVNSTSDGTPLDTDLSMITESSYSVGGTVKGSGAYEYGGGIFLVLKNRDNRFNITRGHNETITPTYDSEQLELFYTGFVNTDNSKHYGIRTGFASSEIDYIILDKERPLVFLEIAMNGFYIPVIDFEGKMIFTPKDYDNLRDQMRGLSYYSTLDYEFSDNLYSDEINEIATQVDKNNLEIKYKKDKINSLIEAALNEVGLSLKTYIDGDLTEGSVELVDTGSTGRGTNQIGDGDFDFMMKLDRVLIQNKHKFEEFKKVLLSKFPGHEHEVISSGDFRFKNVVIDDVIVDIDITFTEKTDKVTYSTDMCLVERLEHIKAIDKDKYNYVIANILLAKKVLKNALCYKPNRGEVPQGGMGGVGIENWILQNGGSFYDACSSFLRAAEGKTFEQFKEYYRVFDFGENHLSRRNGYYSHDNFVYNNMSEEGYEKMRDALNTYIYEVDYCTRKTSSLN